MYSHIRDTRIASRGHALPRPLESRRQVHHEARRREPTQIVAVQSRPPRGYDPSMSEPTPSHPIDDRGPLWTATFGTASGQVAFSVRALPPSSSPAAPVRQRQTGPVRTVTFSSSVRVIFPGPLWTVTFGTSRGPIRGEAALKPPRVPLASIRLQPDAHFGQPHS